LRLQEFVLEFVLFLISSPFRSSVVLGFLDWSF